MCEDCHCSDLKPNTRSVLKPQQGRPYIHIDGSVRYQPLPTAPEEHPHTDAPSVTEAKRNP